MEESGHINKYHEFLRIALNNCADFFIYCGHVLEIMRFDILDESSAYCYISTFSGAGIGDAGIHWGSNVPLLLASELAPERANMLKRNFAGRKKNPAKIIQGNIEDTKNDIIEHCENELEGLNPWLVVL